MTNLLSYSQDSLWWNFLLVPLNTLTSRHAYQERMLFLSNLLVEQTYFLTPKKKSLIVDKFVIDHLEISQPQFWYIIRRWSTIHVRTNKTNRNSKLWSIKTTPIYRIKPTDEYSRPKNRMTTIFPKNTGWQQYFELGIE